MLKKINILKILSWFVFAGLIMLFAIIISPALSIPGVPRSHVVITGSMEPTIPVGSIVFTQDVDPRSLIVGDIIAFESPNQAGDTILHRINTIKSTEPLLFETKGDANDTSDNWDVVEVGIRGKYVFAIPFLGHAASYIRTPIGFAIMIGLPALAFIISQILNIKRAIRSEIQKGIDSKTKPPKSVFPVILLFVITSTFLLSIRSIQALYVDTVTISGITLSVKDFVPPPTPQLLTPANNSYQNTLGLVMDWSDVSDYENQHNPVYYIYESFHDPLLNHLAYRSGKLGQSNIPAPGSPDGIYYWHVKACDTVDNCSPWSDPWKVTVDSTSPSLPQNLNYLNPNLSCGDTTTSLTITPNWDNSLDQNFSHYEYQSYNPPTAWVWSTTVTQSQYSGTFSQGYGTYGFRVRGVDMAGNKSDWTAVDFDDSCQVVYVPIVVDNTPPVSNITNTDFATNNPNIDIGYTMTDTNPDFVTLYYSFGLNPWQVGDTSSSGSISFVASNGDGVYCFETVGQDSYGNVESGVLPPPPNINPLDPDIYCLTLDNTDPVSTITNPIVSSNNHISIGTSISSWDGLIKGTAYDSSLQGLDHVELSIQKDSTDFWDGTAWIGGTESSVRITALGTTVWSYQLPDTPDPGQYTIISHAVDKAGNIENSAVIEFTYQPDKIEISSSYNPATNYLNLIFSNIPQVFGNDSQDDLSYDLTYQTDGLQKGLFGQIFPNTVVLGQSVKSEYIGSCSSSGACSPDILDNIQFNLSLTGQISGQDITINQTLP